MKFSRSNDLSYTAQPQNHRTPASESLNPARKPCSPVPPMGRNSDFLEPSCKALEPSRKTMEPSHKAMEPNLQITDPDSNTQDSSP